MCCHPFFKTRIPTSLHSFPLEKGERWKLWKHFELQITTLGLGLNMKVEHSQHNECDSMIYLHFHRLRLLSFSWFWPPLPVHQTNHKYSFYRLSSSLDHHHRLLKWQKKPITTYELKTVKLLSKYSFTLASINYVYMYLTLNTSACSWNQLFMETHN